MMDDDFIYSAYFLVFRCPSILKGTPSRINVTYGHEDLGDSMHLAVGKFSGFGGWPCLCTLGVLVSE